MPRKSQITATALLILAGGLSSGCSDRTHDERLRAAGPNPTIDALMKVADADVGASKFSTCAACHTIAKGGVDLAGPNLYGAYGKPIAHNSPRFGYTAALRDAKGKWDAPTLDAWITDPQKLIPGTLMQFGGIADPLDRADIIAYLRRQTDRPPTP